MTLPIGFGGWRGAAVLAAPVFPPPRRVAPDPAPSRAQQSSAPHALSPGRYRSHCPFRGGLFLPRPMFEDHWADQQRRRAGDLMSRSGRCGAADTSQPQRRPPAGRPGRGLASLRPFRYRAFRLLWAAGLISTIGSWMQTVAVGALVISDTGRATWAVLVAAGAFLPTGLLSPVGGALADRLPRRPLLVIGNLAAAATSVLLAAAVATGHDSPVGLVLLVTLQDSPSALIGPFHPALLPA